MTTRIGQLLERELYEMANIRPDRSGLPMVVWISIKGNAKHGPRLKVRTDNALKWTLDDELAIVSISDNPQWEGGSKLKAPQLKQVIAFIKLNKDVLLDLWNGKIDNETLYSRLKKLN